VSPHTKLRTLHNGVFTDCRGVISPLARATVRHSEATIVRPELAIWRGGKASMNALRQPWVIRGGDGSPNESTTGRARRALSV
jgi:hypothetical protein